VKRETGTSSRGLRGMLTVAPNEVEDAADAPEQQSMFGDGAADKPGK